jgi:hypothetical protein
MIERGDYLRCDDPIVQANPTYFAVPLTRTERVTNGPATN